jgi:NAD(P)-dependent dehydrogenase (short-subunit alcohol dehydrogenase family)
MFSVNNKCVVIAGGLGKVGFPIVEGFLSNGSKVFIITSDSKKHKVKIEYLKSNYANNFFIFNMSIASNKNIQTILDHIKKKFKTPDVFINSAVQRPSQNYKKKNIRIENTIKSVNLNSKIIFLLLTTFAETMKKNKNGASIINISSVYGIKIPDDEIYKGTKYFTEIDYPFLKSGTIMLCKYLASKYGKYNLRINSLCLGGLKQANTNKKFKINYQKKTALNRMMTQEDIVGPSIFLASKASSYITGSVIELDGGFF